MKAAIYIRVSRQDLNLDNQRIPLEEYAKRMGWEYTIFKEKESTRKTRPVQWELYNRLLKREFDILLFYKLDRWARSLPELISHVNTLLEKGIRVVSYTENLDFSTSMGQLMFHIFGAFAQFERDMIRERTIAGLERARAQGKKLGRPRKRKEHKKPATRDVARLHLQGKTPRKIAKELGTSRYWVEYCLKRIQENPDELKGISF